jgi:hypothetical protein
MLNKKIRGFASDFLLMLLHRFDEDVEHKRCIRTDFGIDRSGCILVVVVVCITAVVVVVVIVAIRVEI